ncbi:MAG: hypothetical protein IPK99_11575 [Flavobacteriales bacterium]|nr:hypothetical protein [Flavobacteriales bacterium]
MRAVLAIGSVALLFASCEEPSATPLGPAPSSIVEVRGRVTPIDAGNAPDTIALLPEVVLPAPPYSPTDPTHVGPMAHIRTFTTDDGLPMDDIMCGTLDRNGMLWFGTNGGGITRYDGRSFVNFTTAHGLPDNVILSMLSDRNDDLWIGTSTGGLCKYDGRSFRSVVLNDATGLAKGVSEIVEDKDGALWFGTRGRGVYRYAGGSFTNYTTKDGLSGDHVRAMAQADDGALWMATSHGVAHFAEGKFTAYTEGDGHALNDVWSMTSTDARTIWLGHAKGGVTRCSVNAGEQLFHHYPIGPEDNEQVTALAPAGTNALWVGTKEDGVMRFEPGSGEVPLIRRYTMANGMAGDDVLSITEDARGDLWFGMRGAGLCHYRGEAFSNYTNFRPISLAEDAQGVLHVGTAVGIARREGEGFSEWHPENGFASWVYSMSADAKGSVGFAENLADLERSGFSTLEGDKVRVLGADADRADIFWSMHDRLGRLWLAGRRGIERWSEGRCLRYGTGQGLGNINGLCLHERRDGSIYAGTDGGGFSRIDSTSITTWTTEEGLPNNVVWCIAEDNGGALWIATLGGLCRFDGTSFLTFTAQHGLPDDNINQVLITRDGQLVVGTLQGFAVLTGWRDARGGFIPLNGTLRGATNSAIAQHAPSFEVYNSATGFPVKDVQTAERSLFEDSKGVLWIATGSDKTGLVRFDRHAMRNNTTPLDVRLLSVSVNNEPVCWYHLDHEAIDSTTIAQQEVSVFGKALAQQERKAKRKELQGVRFARIEPHFAIPEGLELDYRNNRVSFEFVGIETARPEVVEYQFMLEGYDAHWSAPSKGRTATYGNIREGDYTFMVKAKGPGGAWSAPLEYRFTVLPPRHRTWWAFVGYLVLIAGAITVVIRRRTAVLRAQKDKLERTVTERTEQLRKKKDEADEQRQRAELSEKAKERFLANMSHEIRTPMNAIMGMSDILKDRPHAPEQAKYLTAIHQSSENLLVIINDILDLTKIDAGRIDFEAVPFDPRVVIGNVCDVLQFKADEKRIALTVEFAPDLPEKLIGDPTRLNQIVMNLAGNAIKFTENRRCSHVTSTHWVDLNEHCW